MMRIYHRFVREIFVHLQLTWICSWHVLVELKTFNKLVKNHLFVFLLRRWKSSEWFCKFVRWICCFDFFDEFKCGLNNLLRWFVHFFLILKLWSLFLVFLYEPRYIEIIFPMIFCYFAQKRSFSLFIWLLIVHCLLVF